MTVDFELFATQIQISPPALNSYLQCAELARSSDEGGDKQMTFREWFQLVRTREEGQTMAEYGVVLAVITIAALVAFQTLGGQISNAIDAVTALLPG